MFLNNSTATTHTQRLDMTTMAWIKCLTELSLVYTYTLLGRYLTGLSGMPGVLVLSGDSYLLILQRRQADETAILLVCLAFDSLCQQKCSSSKSLGIDTVRLSECYMRTERVDSCYLWHYLGGCRSQYSPCILLIFDPLLYSNSELIYSQCSI